MSRRAVLAFVVGWCAIAASVVATAVAAPGLAPAATAVGGTAWAACVLLAARGPSEHLAPPLHRSLAWWCVLAGAVALRVPAFVQGPVFSDDVYRYAWEGALVARGVDPYAHAPDDPSLAEARAELPTVHARVNHPGVPAAYPPLAQLAHAGLVVVARATSADVERTALLLVRAFHAACDLGVLWAIAALLARRGRSPLASVAWGWCPLLAFEFAGSAHLDAFAILLALGAWLCVERARPRERTGAALLAGAALVKLLPIAFAPGWLRERREVRASAIVLACVLVAGSAPMWIGHAPPDGLRAYAERWEGPNVLYRWVLALAHAAVGESSAQLVARGVVVVAWLATVAWAWRRGIAGLDLARVGIAAYLVLTPVLHPWYLAWIAPFVALRADLEWIWMLAAAPLLYAPLADAWERGDVSGTWTEPAWLWPVVMLPFLAITAALWSRSRPR